MATIKVMVILTFTATLVASKSALAAPYDAGTATTTVGPYRAAIFREVDKDENLDTKSFSPLDRMTVREQIEKLYAMSVVDNRGADPAAYLRMGKMDEFYAGKDPADIGPDEVDPLNPNIDRIIETLRMKHDLAIAQANLNKIFHEFHGPTVCVRDQPAIRLGASLRPHERLASNINSHVPDGFTDGEIARMFELNEALRTGERSLDATTLAKTNSHLLSLYLQALAGLEAPVEYEPASGGGQAADCSICRDTLDAEPFMQLACGHRFHTDCITEWVKDDIVKRCPYCRRHFRLLFGFRATSKSAGKPDS